MASNLFRKKALERLSSPERLDELMQVTSPAGWLALGGLGFAIVAAIVWGIIGSIAVKVNGKGILMRGGSVFEITSTLAGHVLAVEVEPGQMVASGEWCCVWISPNCGCATKTPRKSWPRFPGMELSKRWLNRSF